MKVVFGGQIARPPVLKALQAVEGIDFVAVDHVKDVVPHVASADVLVIANPRGSEGKDLAAALRGKDSAVKWVQVVSAGTDGLLSHGIPDSLPVTNQGGAAAPAVAEHAMALMLALARRIGELHEATRRREWIAEQVKSTVTAIEGTTLAIVGYGNIGRQLARRARAFDVKIIGINRAGADDPLADEMFSLDRLHEALSRADTVAVCAALTPETRHLVDAKALAACPRGARLINVSRGEVVDQAALCAALQSGQIGAAALDVTTPEPLPADDPLWGMPNVLISPHIAATGNRNNGKRIAATVVDNLARFRAGQPLIYPVER